MLPFDERENRSNRSTRRKSSRIKEENQQQTDLNGIWRRLRDLNPGHFNPILRLFRCSWTDKVLSQEQEDPWSINSGLL